MKEVSAAVVDGANEGTNVQFSQAALNLYFSRRKREYEDFKVPRPSGLPRMSDETRKLIRRMALSAMVAVGKKSRIYFQRPKSITLK